MATQTLTGLDGRTTREGRGEALEPVCPAAETRAGEVCDELLETARRIKPGVRIRRGMNHHSAAGKSFDFIADALQQLAMLVDRLELGRGEFERQRQQQALSRRAVTGELPHDAFI